jgi:hypothetical protein
MYNLQHYHNSSHCSLSLRSATQKE